MSRCGSSPMFRSTGLNPDYPRLPKRSLSYLLTLPDNQGSSQGDKEVSNGRTLRTQEIN